MRKLIVYSVKNLLDLAACCADRRKGIMNSKSMIQHGLKPTCRYRDRYIVLYNEFVLANEAILK